MARRCRLPPIVSAEEWDAARAELRVKEKQVMRRTRRARGRAAADAVARGRQASTASTRPTASRAWSTCSTGARSSSSTARSSSPACTAGPTTRASAARWWPTRSRTLRISTRATRRWCSRRAHRWPTSSGSRRAWAGSTSPGSRCRRVRQGLRRRRVARHQRVHPRRRPGVPHLLRRRPRRRADGQHLELPRHHRARSPGAVGGLPRRLPAGRAVPVVDLARRAEGDGHRPGAEQLEIAKQSGLEHVQ